MLVVDDAPDIRFLLEVSLSREPKVRLVGQAENGEQAVEKIEKLRPDLVVMDMHMPIMDGVAATRRVSELWPNIEIVGFTSSGSSRAHDAMCEAGAVKSFDKSDVIPLLEFIRTRAATRGEA